MAEWLTEEYIRKPFSEGVQEHYTLKNERVRSKSEAMIADALNMAGIPYKYECPLVIGGRLIHPDFTILRVYDRKIMYWEHLGMMDDIDYRNNAFSRIHEYEMNGIFPGDCLIVTQETGGRQLNNRDINLMIRHYLLPPV